MHRTKETYSGILAQLPTSRESRPTRTITMTRPRPRPRPRPRRRRESPLRSVRSATLRSSTIIGERGGGGGRDFRARTQYFAQGKDHRFSLLFSRVSPSPSSPFLSPSRIRRNANREGDDRTKQLLVASARDPARNVKRVRVRQFAGYAIIETYAKICRGRPAWWGMTRKFRLSVPSLGRERIREYARTTVFRDANLKGKRKEGYATGKGKGRGEVERRESEREGGREDGVVGRIVRERCRRDENDRDGSLSRITTATAAANRAVSLSIAFEKERLSVSILVVDFSPPYASIAVSLSRDDRPNSIYTRRRGADGTDSVFHLCKRTLCTHF